MPTLRNWTKPDRIPHHRVGHVIYYDVAEVADPIRTKLKVLRTRPINCAGTVLSFRLRRGGTWCVARLRCV